MKSAMAVVVAGFLVLSAAGSARAIPTPRMSEDQMMQVCALAAEGQVVAVKLVKRWIGDRPGIDTGYEYGIFECTLRVDKPLKGDIKAGSTIQYTVEAYMQGKWDQVRGFVYEGTQAAVTPGTRLKVFLKSDPDSKQYGRVHFNSGFEVLQSSDQKFPRNVGETITAKAAKDTPANAPR